MKDYYKILGVMPTADGKEIKAAHRKLSKKYHPDTAADSPQTAERFHEIQCAYEILSDPEKREAYDRRWDRRGTGAGQPFRKNDSGQTKRDRQQAPNADMSQFERFFGFQPGKGMEAGQDKKPGAKNPGGPIKPEELFSSFFNLKK